MTEQGVRDRLKQHRHWLDIEQDPPQVYLAAIGEMTSWAELSQPSRATYPAPHRRIILEVEALLIRAHQLVYNQQAKQGGSHPGQGTSRCSTPASGASCTPRCRPCAGMATVPCPRISRSSASGFTHRRPEPAPHRSGSLIRGGQRDLAVAPPWKSGEARLATLDFVTHDGGARVRSWPADGPRRLALAMNRAWPRQPPP